jgi:sugar/nucleoside kinase (ribokinase family)
MGGEGVYVSPAEGNDFHLPAYAIDVVDTTGCGDSFTAGVITGLSPQMAASRMRPFRIRRRRQSCDGPRIGRQADFA